MEEIETGNDTITVREVEPRTLFVFGDSLSDTGNLFNLTSALGNPIPPSPPYFDGRVSNGPVAVEIMAIELDLSFNLDSNFAWAGAKTGRDNSFDNPELGLEFPGLLDQIDTFADTIDSVGADSEALYVVWAGGNDFLPVGGAEVPADPEAAVTNAVTNITTAVTTLTDLGAETIVVPLSVPLNRTPLANFSGDVEVLADISVAFNAELSETLTSLESDREDVDVILVDLFAISEEVAANPTEFGFSNITDPFVLNGEILDETANVEEFFFWDNIHPTTNAHEIYAGVLTAEITRPVASDDRIVTPQATAVTINVLENDSDPLDDPLAITDFSSSTANGGTIILEDNGNLLYSPEPEFTGIDSFEYTITDPEGNTDSATVSVQVNIIPDFVIELADLVNGTDGFAINGIDADDRSGREVSRAGDINGDGIDDLAIGALYADPDGIEKAGETYVLFGNTSGFNDSIDLGELDGSNGFTINGIAENDFSGWSVSDAGDINGDGIDDLIIGAINADPEDISNAGVSYLVFGSSNPFSASIDLGELNGSNGFRINGIGELDNSGFTVSGAGDINGDGINDLIIGSTRGELGDIDSTGTSYVVFGSEEGFAPELDLSALDGSNGFTIGGINFLDFAGLSVSGAGDINGDGLDDLVIGAPGGDDRGENSGQSYVVFGTSEAVGATVSLTSLNGSNGFIINGVNAGDFSGSIVRGVGDINGDGIDDLMIGSFRGDPNGKEYGGITHVVFGSSTQFNSTLDLSTLDGTNGFAILGINPGDESSFSVNGAGDINGDGLDDLIIGAPFADAGAKSNIDDNTKIVALVQVIVPPFADAAQSNAGEAYILFGSSAFNATLELQSLDGSNGLVLNGINAFDSAGFSVSGAGDINGDGLDDLIVGAPYANSNGNIDAGASYVLFGSTSFSSVGPSAPVAVNDSVTTSEGMAVTIDVLANDSDADGDIELTDFGQPSNGNVVLDDDQLIYTPAEDFSGTDSFTYSIVDTDGNSDSATVSVTVTADPPPSQFVNLIRGNPGGDMLMGTSQNDLIISLGGNDIINSRSGDDIIFAGFGADNVTGGMGNDELFGGRGNDVIQAGPGDDILNGGSGQDILLSGPGSDIFVLSTETAVVNRSQVDVLVDFQVGEDAIGLTGGLTSDDLILESLGTNTIVKIGESNLILGMVNRVAPDELNGSFVPFDLEVF